MRVTYSRKAADELAGILEFLNSVNPAAARQVAAVIRGSIDGLLQHPRKGRLQDDGSRKLVATPYPYLIFYDVSENGEVIEIATTQHGFAGKPAR